MFILAAAGFPAAAFYFDAAGEKNGKNGRFVNDAAENCAKYTKLGIIFCDAQNKCYKYFEILNIKSKN